MPLFVVLACGSRDWDAYGVVESTVSTLHFQRRIARLIHGACRGADRIAGDVAKRLAIDVVEYPARWNEGRSAGPRRNHQMLVDGKPDLVVAFHDCITESKGTRDMVERASSAGVEVWVVQSSGSKLAYTKGTGRLFS